MVGWRGGGGGGGGGEVVLNREGHFSAHCFRLFHFLRGRSRVSVNICQIHLQVPSISPPSTHPRSGSPPNNVC